MKRRALDADLLARKLLALQGDVTASRYLVGFSGGLDSTVLLHALKKGSPGTPIVAVHINHALHADAAAWQAHCARIAEGLGVGFVASRVQVVEGEGTGLEAAARKARYGGLRALMQEGDVLLSAHHQEDQAETLMLNLLRGSGLAGLAGIGARQRFGPGLLIRPLLGISRADIERYARACDLRWIEDPANQDLRFDRNYLRREIMPRLRLRWPAAAARLGRSAELAAEAQGLQDDLATLDLARLADSGDGDAATRPARLDVEGLLGLSAARQRNVLRYAIRACGLPQAPSSRLRQIREELLTARADARPLVRWAGAEARRYRSKLYLLERAPPAGAARAETSRVLYGDGQEVPLGALGTLRLEPCAGPGIDPQLVAGGLSVRFRAGGEKLKPYGQRDTRPLKKLLQEHEVVPWMRQNLPLLFAGDTLVAVADLWIAADCAGDDGFQVRWNRKLPIF